MAKSIHITSIDLDKAYFHPAETVHGTISLESQVTAPAKVTLEISFYHVAEKVYSQNQAVTVSSGQQNIGFSYTPPETSPAGYGIDVRVLSESGSVLATSSTAFDVLNNWTDNPRYGFMTNFRPDRSDLASVMQSLARYHINGLQFYDWMYRHEQLLTDIDPYTDLWSNVPHSIKTIDDMITTAHQYSIAAMPYTAVYGASMEFYDQHPDWVLYDAAGKPTFFGGDMMAIMDPRPNSPWTIHLLDQFDQVMQKTAFDGIHLDQYGDPKIGHDAQGKSFDLAPVLAEFINQTKALVEKYRPDGAVVFNAVTNWPIEAVAPADEDFVYIEVWSPYNWFSDLRALIINAQQISNGKPVVLAAYIDPAYEINARIMDAIIFASGGSRIELGEMNGMLAEPYFPNFKVMSPDLVSNMQHYYDFMVRYENVIGPSTQDATKQLQGNIQIANVQTAPAVTFDKVWPIVRRSQGMTAISLVNLLGITKPDWAVEVTSPPTPLSNFEMSISGVKDQIAHIWLASPDGQDPELNPLTYSQNGDTITVEIPSLSFWDLILIEWNK